MDFNIIAGDTDKTIYVVLRDSSTFLGKTGIAYNSAGAVCSYTLPLAARAAISLATQTVTGAHTDGGFVEVDATNCKGLYRLDLPDDAIATGDFTTISLEFDGVVEESIHVPLHLRQSAVANLGSGSSGAVNIAASQDNSSGAIIDSVTKVGTITGDYNNVHADTNGNTIISIADVGNDIDFVIGYDVGGSRAGASVSIIANVNGNNDEIKVKAYNHDTTNWDVIGTVFGSGGTSYQSLDLAIFPSHTGTSSELGKVYVRFDTDSTTPSLLEIDKCVVAAVSTSTSVGYADGAYWVDSAGTSGTEVGTNGTADNPCLWADAITMNASQTLNRFHIANGNTVTLADDIDAFTLFGENWSLVQAGYGVEGAMIQGATLITGIATATVTRPTYEDCQLGAATIPPAVVRHCGIGLASGTLTAGSAGNYDFHECKSLVPGSASPVFAFSGLGSATNISNRAWTGGASWTLDSDCVISHEVLAGGGTTFNTDGADIEARGICRSLTIAVTGANGTTPTVQFVGITGVVTLSGTAAAGMTCNLYGVSSSVSGSITNCTTTDSTTNATDQTAIKTVTDALTSAAATKLALSAGQIITGTVDTATNSHTPTTTEFQADDITTAAADHYNGRIVIFTSGTLAGQATDITDYVIVGGIAQFTVTALTSAPANNATFIII